mmetsp:Transcript_35521/g.43889  ORF Transcript_35521/g.43889 Transcript_35521/m.43889 type:complete len:338 (-) Transcript_35521:70-1083(-)
MVKSMKVALLLALGVCKGESDVSKAFEDFVAKFQKSYATEEEKQLRQEIFAENLAHIEKHNAGKHSYQLGITQFADQKPSEFHLDHVGCMTKTKPWGSLPYLGRANFTATSLPSAVDWVQKGAVTDPKNQGKCGSCWSFSTTGALEGAWQIATGKLVSMSEQQLVDCAKNGNMGCQGGSMDLAFSYLEKHNVCSESSYPYLAAQGTCQESSCSVAVPKGSITGFKDVSAKDMDALMQAVSENPVSVAIEADQMAFQLYKGGILTQECGTKLDHGVLVVGYGTENGVDYWKVKNSWGADWGENGYIRMKRGVPKDGECGIKDQPSYPIVKSSMSELVV